MKVLVEYDSELNICTIMHKNVDIQTEPDVREWRHQVIGELEAIVSKEKKPWLLVDLNEFNIGPKMSDLYAEVAKEVRTYAKNVIRYNSKDLLTRTSIRSKAAKQGYQSHICADRKEALKLLEKLKAEDLKS